MSPIVWLWEMSLNQPQCGNCFLKRLRLAWETIPYTACKEFSKKTTKGPTMSATGCPVSERSPLIIAASSLCLPSHSINFVAYTKHPSCQTWPPEFTMFSSRPKGSWQSVHIIPGSNRGSIVDVLALAQSRCYNCPGSHWFFREGGGYRFPRGLYKFSVLSLNLITNSTLCTVIKEHDCAFIHEIDCTCLVTSYFCQVSKPASLSHSPTFAQSCPRSPYPEPQQAKPCTQSPRSAHQHQKSLI